MPDSRMFSFWVLHLAFRVVELEASLGSVRFDIQKIQAYINDFVIPRRNDPAVRIGLLYSSITTVKLQKQIGNNTAFPSV